MGLVKTCTKCGRLLPIEKFTPAPNYKYGVYSRCRECNNESSKIYYHQNHEKIRSYQKDYNKKLKQEEERLKQMEHLKSCEVLGGWRIYVLNYCKDGEAKYTCVKVSTADVYRTNDKAEFLKYLEGEI